MKKSLAVEVLSAVAKLTTQVLDLLQRVAALEARSLWQPPVPPYDPFVPPWYPPPYPSPTYPSPWYTTGKTTTSNDAANIKEIK